MDVVIFFDGWCAETLDSGWSSQSEFLANIKYTVDEMINQMLIRYYLHKKNILCGWTILNSLNYLCFQRDDELQKAIKLTMREKRFIKFASVEYDGQLYMTPQDFLDSVVDSEPRRK